MDVIVYDPVDQKPMKKSEAYAESDGLYFGSLETQQMYYKLMATGMEVVVVNGKPCLQPKKPVRIFEKEAHLRSMSKTSEGHFTIPNLKEGDYTFIAEVPDLHSSITGARKAGVKLDVTAGNGRDKIKQSDFQLDKKTPSWQERFRITEEQAGAMGATLVADFSSNSIMKSVHVKAYLDYLAPSQQYNQAQHAISEARRMSKSVARSGEYIVELTKGTTGVGMTLGWDKALKSVVIRSIEENGAAARTKKLKVGDRIQGIQGHRVDSLSFKQVIKLLRDVPTTVVLLMTTAPAGYVPQERKGVVRHIDEAKKRPPNRPPRRKPAPGPPPPRAGGAAPPPVPRTNTPPATAARRPPPPNRPSRPQRPSPARPSRPSTEAAGATAAAAAAMAAAPPIPSKSSQPPPPPVPVKTAPPPPPPVPSHQASVPAPPVPQQKASPPPPPVPTPQKSSPPPPPVPQAKSSPPPPPVPSGRAGGPPPPPPTRQGSSGSAAPPPPVPVQQKARPTSGRGAPPPPPPVGGAAQRAPPPPVPQQQQQQQAPPAPPSGGAGPAGFEKYDRMKKAGLPEGAILNAMRRDGVEPPPGYFGDPSIAQESSKPAAPPPIPHHGGGGGGAPPPLPLAGGAGGLLAQINQGVQLRHTPAQDSAPPPPVPGGGGGGGLLGEIQAGVKLKKVDRSAQPPPAPAAPVNPLLAAIQGKDRATLRHVDVDKAREERKSSTASNPANPLSAIAAALDQRRDQLEPDSSDDEEWDDDDEWAM